MGWDQLESGSKTKDRKFVMCQTTEQKMIAKVIKDCAGNYPSRPEAYPDNICIRDVEETLREIVDQFKSNPATAPYFIGLKEDNRSCCWVG